MQAVASGEMPNPCYMLWDGMAMVKLVYDDGVHAEVQVCGDPNTQEATACNPYICESSEGDGICTISRSFRCGNAVDVITDLDSIDFYPVRLVNNSEDWFPRLQYYFIL